ncbi:hypothetical protein KIN20_038298 [Parelaphostrongylus tenuis]|uniref:WH2 domain-containing protein n=1 Tax=Parelaphostrongylus tenuis TaxID=148309 RepID=A0AAD5WMF9_PARTN|nr:hypothetical protein KIN20_038298 [Parelaphostrongylus tenuis]
MILLQRQSSNTGYRNESAPRLSTKQAGQSVRYAEESAMECRHTTFYPLFMRQQGCVVAPSDFHAVALLDRNSIRPSEPFERGPHKTLAESRNSMMVVHKQQRRTPREVKKGSTTRINIDENYQSEIVTPQQATTTVKEIPIDQYLNSNWGSTPPFELQEKLHVISECNGSECSEISKAGICDLNAFYTISSRFFCICAIRSLLRNAQRKIYTYKAEDVNKALYDLINVFSVAELKTKFSETTTEQVPPPVPFRVESKQSQFPLQRAKSPTNSSEHQESRSRESFFPRTPKRKQSGTTMSIWRIEIPLPNGAQVPQHSPPPTPPSSQPSPVPSLNESSLRFPHKNLSVAVAVPTELLTLASPPPPPPPPNLLSPAPTPPPSMELQQSMSNISLFNTNSRKNLLEEIQNVDRSKLRHVDRSSKSISNDDDSSADGGLLVAIQAELDKRREYIVTDSDNESDSTGSEWAD